MSNNYGSPHMPKLVRTAVGRPQDRTTQKYIAKDSAAIYLGGFVPLWAGSDSAPQGLSFGVPAFTDDYIIGGVVVGFSKLNHNVPIQDDSGYAGTVTNATGQLPMKYTFGASNDQENTTAATLECIEVLPVLAGDVWEVSLWGGSTSPANRGTTVAYGTTDSTANFGTGLSVAATYDFALLESGGDEDLENKDFYTVLLDGNQPTLPFRVYVAPLRTQTIGVPV